MDIYCGIDFGTTNTVVSLVGKRGNVIDLISIPTTLFIPHEKDGISRVIIGDDALGAFKEKMAGRYIHSIKRSLSDSGLTKTRINNHYVTIEEIIALFLRELMSRAFAHWGIKIEKAVVGRPVKFSINDEDDRLAFERLKEGFRKAGFKENHFLEEPIAASYCFEDILNDRVDHFLIMDFGGGTSDYSLISYHGERKGIDKYEVIKLDGIDGGGDHFDEVLMFKRICPLLAMSATYESFGKRLPMPVHIFNHLCRWNNFIVKDIKDLNGEFHDFSFGSSDRQGVERLYRVIKERESFDILGGLKKAKHKLTGKDVSSYQFDDEYLEFTTKGYIDETAEIRDRILQGLNRMECYGREENISLDRIILTGGSSRNRTFLEYFSNDKRLHFDKDHYYSIAKGLARYAYYSGLRAIV